MSSFRLAKIAIAGVAVLSVATPANALAATHGAAARHHTTKPAPHHGKKHHGKPAAARFTAVGVVSAVDATGGTLTLNDKGGSPDLHGKSVRVTVGTATKITRDDVVATLAQIQVGDQVMANGTRADGGVLNAAHLNASSTPDAEPTDTPTAAPTSTDTPTGSTSPTATP